MRPHPLLLSILAVLPGCTETFVTDGCFDVEENTTTCPDAKSVSLDDLYLRNECGSDLEIAEMKSKGPGVLTTAPLSEGPICCYQVEVIDHEPGEECIIGRPYLEQGKAQLAPLGLNTSPLSTSPTSTHRLEARANAWALAGAAEHASVAAFNRLSLQLLALGAPLALLNAVQRAAMEEVQHAQACFELATKFGASDVSVGAFPFAGTIDPNVDLVDLAYAAVREGCLAETLGACVVSNVADMVPDEHVRTVLQQLAREESEHAVLSFRIVTWAVQVGGTPVREAVTRALHEPWPQLDVTELAFRTGLDTQTLTRATHDAYRRVLEPATRALLRSC